MTPAQRKKAIAAAKEKAAHARVFETDAAAKKDQAVVDRLLKQKPQRKRASIKR